MCSSSCQWFVGHSTSSLFKHLQGSLPPSSQLNGYCAPDTSRPNAVGFTQKGSLLSLGCVCKLHSNSLNRASLSGPVLVSRGCCPSHHRLKQHRSVALQSLDNTDVSPYRSAGQKSSAGPIRPAHSLEAPRKSPFPASRVYHWLLAPFLWPFLPQLGTIL